MTFESKESKDIQREEQLWHYLCFTFFTSNTERTHTLVFSTNDFCFKKYWLSIKNIWRLYLCFSLKNSIFLRYIFPVRYDFLLCLQEFYFPRQWTFFTEDYLNSPRRCYKYKLITQWSEMEINWEFLVKYFSTTFFKNVHFQDIS